MQKILFSFVLGVVSILTFLPLRNASLVWDDPRIASLQSGHEHSLVLDLVQSWRFSSDKVYAPLSETVRLLVKASNPNHQLTARHLHTLNVSLHSCTAIVVFLILALIIQNLPASFMGALLFCLHPLQVEPVAYVSALPQVLGTFWACLAVWFYLQYLQRWEERGSRRSPRRLYTASFCYFLSILTSPAFVVTPVIAHLIARLTEKRESLLIPKRPQWPLVVWSVVGGCALILALRAISSQNLIESFRWWQSPLIAGDALSFYLSKVFVPLFVGPDYGRAPAVILSQWWGYVTWVLPLIVCFTLPHLRGRKAIWYWSAVLVSLVALLPYLGFVELPAQHISSVRDRYFYFAMLGPALALAYAISMARHSWLPVLSIVGLFAATWLTRNEVKHWQNDVVLWEHALKVNPDSPIAHEILGYQFRTSGDLERAKEHYEKALIVNRSNPEIYYFLAKLEASSGNQQKAIELYEKVLAIDAKFAPAYVNLGVAKLALGDSEAAKDLFRQAIALAPNDPLAVRNLGMILARNQAYADAVPYLEQAISSNQQSQPDELAETHALLGLALAKLGRFEAARPHLEQSMALAPELVASQKVMAEIEFAAGHYDLALPYYQKVVSSGSGDRESYQNLGIILSQQKRYDDAIEAFTKALKFSQQSVETHLELGIAYFRLRRLQEARQQFVRVLELRPTSAEAHYFLGDIARWQNKNEEALASYYRAVRIDPHHIDANMRLGNYFLGQANPQEALRHFQAALKKSPDDSKLKYYVRRAERAISGDDSTKM